MDKCLLLRLCYWTDTEGERIIIFPVGSNPFLPQFLFTQPLLIGGSNNSNTGYVVLGYKSRIKFKLGSLISELRELVESYLI